MYSFVLRAHQKIDKVAYRHLEELMGKPPLSLKAILHFEGPRGPDATKLKKGKAAAPWHFYDPAGTNEVFLKVIDEHYRNLVSKLRSQEDSRAAFEAAWLAHALVDGLTPAHHFPYEAGLEALHNASKDTRETVGSHFMVKGETRRDTIKRSFGLIGPKGLLTTHTTFEAGAAMIILPLTMSRAKMTAADVRDLHGVESLIKAFKAYAEEIQHLDMYGRFYKRGWTPMLARDIKLELAPRMARIVNLAWYTAFLEAGQAEAKK